MMPQLWRPPALSWAWALRCRQLSRYLTLRLSVSSFPRTVSSLNASSTGKGDWSAVMRPVLTTRRGSSEEIRKLLSARKGGVMLTVMVWVSLSFSSVNSARMAA